MMILEGLITTINADGSVNISPMGPIVDASMRELTLRPYQTSTTYRNLKRNGQGVLHVTDDVELLARAAVGRLDPLPELLPAQAVEGWILAAACRWYAFQVRSLDDSQERTTISAEVIDSGRLRNFFGFNRAKHAVVEAAILATRIKFLPAEEIRGGFARLAVLVEKTGGPAEHRAFGFLQDYVSKSPRGDAPAPRRVIVVKSPSRLHFGMFSFGQPGVRQFGGAGAMIDSPGVDLRISAADRLHVDGPSSERVRTFVERAALGAEWIPPEIPCRIEIKNAPPAHIGLGSGTQLGMAAAIGLNAFFRGPWRTAEEFACAVGRGRRSAIGLHGAMMGGFLVEAGKFADDEISPLVARIELPPEWRFALFWPRHEQGLAGEAESQAFEQLPPISAATTQALCQQLLLELAPAAAERDFDRFGESLHRFGRLAGQCFAAQQGGAYASPRIAGLVEHLRSLGVRGVGQSSWGPAVFALTPDVQAAQELVAQIGGDVLEFESLVAAPANRGVQAVEQD
jgi:beta-RFAP synthase